MAVLNISTSAELIQAMLDANQGDHIACAGGSYAALSRQSPIVKNASSGGFNTFDSNVVIRPADRNNPPVWDNGRFDVKGLQGFTFDGIWWHGTAVETPIPGVSAPGTYPDLREALRFYDCRNIKFKNCSIKWHLSQLRITNCEFFELDRNRFWQAGIDNIMLYGSSDDIWIHHNIFDEPRIDYGRHHESDRHPDAIQARVNTSQVGTNPFNRLKIEDNYFYFDSQSGKPIFMANQSGVSGAGYMDTIVRRNSSFTGRSVCIGLGGQRNCLVTGNRARSLTTNQSDVPRIFLYGTGCTGEISDNVMPIGPFQEQTGADVADYDTSNNVSSSTANPSVWVELVPGENVGPYTDGEEPETPSAPDQPTDANTDGGFVGYELVPGYTDRFAPVLSVKTTAPAFSSISANVGNARWIRGGVSTVKPFEYADPKFDENGSVRLRCLGGALGNLDIFSMLAGGSFTGMTWEWRHNGGNVWSGMSTFSASISVPSTPDEEPADIPALQPGDWAIDTTPREVAPGLSTAAISLSVTYTGAQWRIDGDTVWRPTIDAGGGWRQLAPLEPGGTEHMVPYEGTLTIWVRYSIDADFGPESTTSKTFTAPAEPAAPDILDGWLVGDQILSGGSALRVAGFPLTIAGQGVPPAIQAEDEYPVFVSDDVITVTLPPSPPPGAVDQIVFYASRAWVVSRNDPRVSFPLIVGETFVYAAGITAEGRLGLLAFWSIP